jgi:hypothetical protein
MQVKYQPSHITGRTFSLRDTEVIICIILVLLKTAKDLNHYLYVLFRQTQPNIKYLSTSRKPVYIKTNREVMAQIHLTHRSSI